MQGLTEIARFECRFQLRAPLFAVVALVFFAVHFLAARRTGISLGLEIIDTSGLALNAAFNVIQNEAILSFFGMFPAMMFVIAAITRDHERNTAELFFVTPLAERSYLFGRFLGGFAFAALVGVAGLLGTLTALSIPWGSDAAMDPFSFGTYVYCLAVFVVPNTFIFAAICYSAAALTRSMAIAFSVAFVFLATTFAVVSLMAPENAAVMALLDPFGMSAMIGEVRYWTAAELAADLPWGSVLVNRAVWIGIGAATLASAAWRYRFRLAGSDVRRRARSRPARTPAPELSGVRVAPRFSTRDALRQLVSQLRMELRGVVLSVPFYVALALAVQKAVTHFAGGGFEVLATRSFPVTSLMLSAYRYYELAILFIIYYSAELVHRERQARVAEIVDASPFPDGLSVLAKTLTLWLAVTVLMLVTMLTSIGLQAVRSGYTNFELDLYLTGLFGFNAFHFCMLCVLAVVIQAFSANKWLGMLAVLGTFAGLLVMPPLGFEHVLYGFRIPYVVHSDMNGFGHFVVQTASLTAYWLAFCVLLIVVGHLAFPRGLTEGVAQRIADFRSRITRRVVSTAAAAMLAFVALGAWIFYNTNVRNEYVTAWDIAARQAEYERAYEQYAGRAVPQPAELDVAIDLFPDERRLASRGTARLVNLERAPIDEVIFTLNPELVVNSLTLTDAAVVEANPELGVYRYRFAEPLAGGESATMGWDLVWSNEGFRNAYPNYEIVANGTYVDGSSIIPVPGYIRERELEGGDVRRRHGLPPQEPLPKLGDPDHLDDLRNGIKSRATFHAVLGTSADQIAVAPGRLQQEWTQGDRRYFEYLEEEPGWPIFAFSSARYEIARDAWNDVPLEIYHDPKHEYAIATMMETIKRSLDYFMQTFSPYQYRQFRIVEFPRYRTFARAFPGMAQYSEAVGFVARFDDGDLDFATAHELAHQWWGGQAMGPRMQGTQVLNEGLATYSALMVIHETLGLDAVLPYLRATRDGYLRNRARDSGEQPVMYAESANVAYNRAGLAMFALQDMIGEDKVSHALSNYLEKHAFQPAPFPTTRDLVDELRAVAGSEYQDLITDLFEKITFYDLSVASAKSEAVDGGFEVTIEVSARQTEATGAGVESEVPLSTYFDIAVFPDAHAVNSVGLPAPIYLEKHHVTSGAQTIVVRVPERPLRAGIDPYGKMIDRDIADNLSSITAQ